MTALAMKCCVGTCCCGALEQFSTCWLIPESLVIDLVNWQEWTQTPTVLAAQANYNCVRLGELVPWRVFFASHTKQRLARYSICMRLWTRAFLHHLRQFQWHACANACPHFCGMNKLSGNSFDYIKVTYTKKFIGPILSPFSRLNKWLITYYRVHRISPIHLLRCSTWEIKRKLAV